MKHQQLVETILTEQEIGEIKELAYAIANEMTDRVLFTHMGILNAIMWRAATDYGVNPRNMELDNWKNLLLCSKNQEVNIVVAHKYLEDYLINQWHGAFYNPVTLRTYRKLHIQWGLFWFDIDSRPKGAAWGASNGIKGQGIATPPVLERVDIPKVLIFYQVFDQVRRDRINWKLKRSENITSFECMPEHGGMLMVQLYNALFFTTSDFRGNCYGHSDIVIEIIADNGEVIQPLPIFKSITWKWFKRKGLFRMIWERMVVKAGFIAQQAILIPSRLTDKSLGDLREVPY
jgi:hypothetical protein